MAGVDQGNAGAGGGGPSGGNTLAASEADKRARAGDQSTALAGAASTTKTDLIGSAIEELRAWFEKHFRSSNELSQDTQLHNAVHGAVASIQGLLGERAG